MKNRIVFQLISEFISVYTHFEIVCYVRVTINEAQECGGMIQQQIVLKD